MYDNSDSKNRKVRCLKCLIGYSHYCWSRTFHAARCFATQAIMLAVSTLAAVAATKPTIAPTDIQAHVAIPLAVQISAANVFAAERSSQTAWLIRLSLIPAFGCQWRNQNQYYRPRRQFGPIILLQRLGRMTESMSVGQCAVSIARFCADLLPLNFRVLCCTAGAARCEQVDFKRRRNVVERASQ
jgi:hypothetical protein